MNPQARRALSFAATFLPLFALFIALYLVGISHYQALVCRVANGVLTLLEPLLRIELGDEGGWDVFWVREGGRLSPAYQMASEGQHLLTMNVALLPALLLATPGRWRARLEKTVLGLAILLVVHVVVAVVLVHTKVALARDPSFLVGALRQLAQASGQFSAIAIWALLSWTTWLPGARRSTEDANPG